MKLTNTFTTMVEIFTVVKVLRHFNHVSTITLPFLPLCVL